MMSKAALKTLRYVVDAYTTHLADEKPDATRYAGQGTREFHDAMRVGLDFGGWTQARPGVWVTAARPDVQIRFEPVGKKSERYYFEPRPAADLSFITEAQAGQAHLIPATHDRLTGEPTRATLDAMAAEDLREIKSALRHLQVASNEIFSRAMRYAATHKALADSARDLDSAVDTAVERVAYDAEHPNACRCAQCAEMR